MFQTIEDAIGGVSTVPEEKKAVFIKDVTKYEHALPGQKLSQGLYKMEPAYEGNDYIVVSASDMRQSPFGKIYETYIFAANSEGEIVDIGNELLGSQKGTHSHEKVLKDIGYKIV